ncbi:MAG TPA: protein kinase [Sandaracinaceae bacterium]
MAESDDLVGQILLGKLEVVRRIGGGGMGVVYEVEHRLTGHRRALKVVHAKYADRPRFMKRLLREARVAGTLKTPYVVETYDAGRLEDGSAYVLMELLHGRSLYDLLQEEGRLGVRRVAEIMSQVAEGIGVAHAAGIVHRDLKPENVFLVKTEDGENVKILDFGVSKFDDGGDSPTRLTVEGTLVGTPYYMSPEQAAGRTVDARTDVYAMGVMMYEALAGRLPFEADSVGALFVKIGAGECVPLRIRRPDLDESVCEIVHRAFHRDPAQRFESAEALRRELVKLLGGGATAARAKTISDGARATMGYSSELPRPPRTPAEAGEVVAADEDDEARALSAPPQVPSKAGKSVPAWAWAAGGALVVLLVVVPWQLSRGGRHAPPPSEPVTTLDEPPAASPPPPTEAEPRAEPPSAPHDAGAPALAEPRPRPRHPPNRAAAAGLEPNPYRRR